MPSTIFSPPTPAESAVSPQQVWRLPSFFFQVDRLIYVCLVLGGCSTISRHFLLFRFVFNEKPVSISLPSSPFHRCTIQSELRMIAQHVLSLSREKVCAFMVGALESYVYAFTPAQEGAGRGTKMIHSRLTGQTSKHALHCPTHSPSHNRFPPPGPAGDH